MCELGVHHEMECNALTNNICERGGCAQLQIKTFKTLGVYN